MTLKGWTKPLSEHIVQAIKDGKVKVCQAKDYEYLQGKITNSQGTIIEFQ